MPGGGTQDPFETPSLVISNKSVHKYYTIFMFYFYFESVTFA